MSEQWQFLKGKSTTGTLFMDDMRPWKWMKSCVKFFLDLSKAFDKVPHITLLSKLSDLNLPHSLTSFTLIILYQRLQHVVNGESSAPICVKIPCNNFNLFVLCETTLRIYTVAVWDSHCITQVQFTH